MIGDRLSPEQRARFWQFITNLATIAISVLGARFGIPIPPPVVPPGSIPAPNVHVAPPTIVLPQPPAVPPTEPPGGQQNPKPAPEKAICRLSFPGVGCTATVIGPRRPDGRWWVLTASHCVKSLGQHGTIRFLDGRTTGVVVAAIDRTADCCWMYTESNKEQYPYAFLASSTPPSGTTVWHAGYGIDKPGNRETGSFVDGPNIDGQVHFRLSVSSGDSGGGILATDTGLVLSCVCCTSSRGRSADVYGASPEAIARLLPSGLVLDDWEPVEIPLVKPGGKR